MVMTKIMFINLRYVWHCIVIMMTCNNKIIHSRMRYFKACMKFVIARMRALVLRITRPYRRLYRLSERYASVLVLMAQYQNRFYNGIYNDDYEFVDSDIRNIVYLHNCLLNDRQDPNRLPMRERWQRRVVEKWLQKWILFCERNIMSQDLYDMLFFKEEVC